MNCAGIAALREEWALALRLSGAAERDQEAAWLCRATSSTRHFTRATMVRAREALGADAADAAFAAGRAMDVDTALREAEAWLAALPPDERAP